MTMTMYHRHADLLDTLTLFVLTMWERFPILDGEHTAMYADNPHLGGVDGDPDDR